MKNKRADENIYKFTYQHWKDKGYKNYHYFNMICCLPLHFTGTVCQIKSQASEDEEKSQARTPENNRNTPYWRHPGPKRPKYSSAPFF